VSRTEEAQWADQKANVQPVSQIPQYPVNLNLVGASCLVVGGGHIAARKVAGLLESGAVVTVVAPEATADLVNDERVRWHQRPYRRGEVASYRLAISATGIPAVDDQVSRDARATGIPVNVADVPDRCTFTLPAILRRGDIQVAVSTNGRSPVLSGWIRDRIADVLPDALPALVDVLSEARAELRASGRTSEIPGWRAALDDGLYDLVAAGEIDEAGALLRRHIGLAEEVAQ
jgi:precorrin-2 dehydrogenase / sirohydrochlorin ferrochelatase